MGRPPFSNSLWVGIETMQFHIAQTKIFLRTPSFPIQGVPMNNLAPMKNCPGGVQGNLNWMPGYIKYGNILERDKHKKTSHTRETRVQRFTNIICKICYLKDCVIFNHRSIIYLNKLGRGLLGYATYQISKL